MAGLDNLKLNFCVWNPVGNGKVHSEIMEILAKVLMAHKMQLNTVVCLFNPDMSPLYKCLFCHFVGVLAVLSLSPLPALNDHPTPNSDKETPPTSHWNPGFLQFKLVKHLLTLIHTEIFALMLWHSPVQEHYCWICVQDFPAGISWMSVTGNPKGSRWHFLNLFTGMGSLLWRFSKD